MKGWCENCQFQNRYGVLYCSNVVKNFKISHKGAAKLWPISNNRAHC
jgi:hypothetical protein